MLLVVRGPGPNRSACRVEFAGANSTAFRGNTGRSADCYVTRQPAEQKHVLGPDPKAGTRSSGLRKGLLLRAPRLRTELNRRRLNEPLERNHALRRRDVFPEMRGRDMRLVGIGVRVHLEKPEPGRIVRFG